MDGNKMYGYVRVSTKEQNEDRQVTALLEYGVKRENIIIDKLSGKDFNRPKYLKMLKEMKPEDTLIIKSIDRLGRNYEEIMEQWRIITKELRVFIAVLDMPLLDTRKKEKDLTGVFIADLVLQILSYVAQTERDFNRQRQAEGIAAARARGVHMGRPRMTRPKGFYFLSDAWHKNNISARTAAKQLDVAPRTFILWAREGQNDVENLRTSASARLVDC